MPAPSEARVKERYRILGDELGQVGIDVDRVKDRVKAFDVEVPSWVFGKFGGGRFGDYMPPGPARTFEQKLQDAAFVHQLTGAASHVAIHVGWDKPDDIAFGDVEPGMFAEPRALAQELGLDFGAVNPTLFLTGTHHGSLSSPMPDVRRMLIEHCKISCDIAHRHARGLVTYWLPDGTNYPGQRDLWKQEKLVREALQEICDYAPETVEHLIEYKLFEPGTYSTVIGDAWAACDIADSLGQRAGVLVDMGHHAYGVNIEQIVARLIGTGRPGGFHFNTRYAADDDHAVEPNRPMFSIFFELVKGNVVCSGDPDRDWAYMIDQCSALEKRIPALLHTMDSLQVSLAKALIVDRDCLNGYQDEQEIIRANRALLDAFLTDVRPIIRMARLEQDLPLDPVQAYFESGYQQKIEEERQ